MQKHDYVTPMTRRNGGLGRYSGGRVPILATLLAVAIMGIIGIPAVALATQGKTATTATATTKGIDGSTTIDLPETPIPEDELDEVYERESKRNLPILPRSRIVTDRSREETIGPMPKRTRSSASSVRVRDTLPTSYQAATTSVKDQGDFGVCWSFGTIAAMEASMLKNGTAQQLGLTEDTLNLSERHLAYFTYNTPEDPLGNTDGDYVQLLGETTSEWDSQPCYLTEGGNADMTMKVLASKIGAAAETTASYDALEQAYRTHSNGDKNFEGFLNETNLSDGVAFDAVAHLSGAYFTVVDDNMDAVKSLIMEHGAVVSPMFYELKYMNMTNSAYFYDDLPNNSSDNYEGANHMITIVGWDDSYSKDKFGNNSSSGANLKPSGNGAWLCKNSWGSTGWGSHGGYFWISYEDHAINDAEVTAFEAKAAEQGHAYQHDGGQGFAYTSVGRGGGIASSFAVPSGSGKLPEQLKSVGLMFGSTNVSYSIQVYANVTNPSDPTSGTPMLATPVQGTTTFAGYYDVELPDGIILAPGSQFSVVASNITRQGYSSTMVLVDSTMVLEDLMSCVSACEENETFQRDSASDPWIDCDTSDAVIRMKAFTVDYDGNNVTSASINVASAQYTGSAVTPQVTVTMDGVTLQQGTDYTVAYSNNINAGSNASVTISGKGIYTGSKSVNFTITPAPMSSVTAAPISAVTYNGSAQTPNPQLTYNGTTLQKGSDGDYTVSYQSNVNAGTATVTVTGRGNYTDTKTVTFTITPVSIESATVAAMQPAFYTGSPRTPGMQLTFNGIKLVAGTNKDYTVSYQNNTNVGTATAIATGRGNYTGTKTATFVIKPFTDVSSSTYHAADVEWLFSAGISTGFVNSDSTRSFRPLSPVARCDMAAFLFRLAKNWGLVNDSWTPTAYQKSKFCDVDTNTPHAREIWWLAASDISTGWYIWGRYEFRPYSSVTRQDMAAFLFRLAKLAGKGGASSSWTASSAAKAKFRDVSATAPDNHHNEVWWLAQTGISTGWDVGGGKYEFRGLQNIARCDMAAFLHRMSNL